MKKYSIYLFGLCILGMCTWYWMSNPKDKQAPSPVSPANMNTNSVAEEISRLVMNHDVRKYVYSGKRPKANDCLFGEGKTPYRVYLEFTENNQSLVRIMNSDLTGMKEYFGSTRGDKLFLFNFEEPIPPIATPKTFHERSFNRVIKHSINPGKTYLVMTIGDLGVQWAVFKTPDQVDETVHIIVSPKKSGALTEKFKSLYPKSTLSPP